MEIRQELETIIDQAINKLIEGNKDTEEANQMWSDGVTDLYRIPINVYYDVILNAREYISKATDQARQEIHEATQKLIDAKYEQDSDKWNDAVTDLYNIPLHMMTYLIEHLTKGKDENNG